MIYIIYLLFIFINSMMIYDIWFYVYMFIWFDIWEMRYDLNDGVHFKLWHSVIPSRAKGKLLKALGSMMKTCGCDQSPFKTWLAETFCACVSESRGETSHAMAGKIQDFCTVFQALPSGFQKHVHKSINEQCANVLAICEQLIANTLPAIFQVLAKQFYKACLDQQQWFQSSTSGVMPAEETQDFWMKASLFEVPSERMACLVNMSSALMSVVRDNSAQATALKECGIALKKATLMQKLCHFQFVVLRDRLLQDCTMETFAESLGRLQEPIQVLMSTFAKFKTEASEEVTTAFQTYIIQSVVEPLGDKMLGKLLHGASEATSFGFGLG